MKTYYAIVNVEDRRLGTYVLAENVAAAFQTAAIWYKTRHPGLHVETVAVTTIYSNDDRYRGLKGLRTVVFMNESDMRDRGLAEFDLVDITSFSRDGTKRTVHGYRAVRYEIPSGSAAGYMPELNVLCGIADVSTQSDQPVTKHLVVEVTRINAPARSG